MKYTTLPHSDIRVSTIAMGCWALCGDENWGPQSEADSIAAVHAACEAGINFFDTAPGYGGGLSEQRLGKGLADRRDQVVVATKVSPDRLSARGVKESVEKSLSDLAMDYVDLVQIHWPSREVPLSETWSALEDLKREGKVRQLGVSNFGREDLADLLAVGAPCINQVPYSLLSRAVEFEIAPACLEAGVGLLCYSPLLWGILTGKYQRIEDIPPKRARSRHFASSRGYGRHTEPGCEAETFEALAAIRRVAARVGAPMADLAVAWLLHRPAVTSVLAGIRNPEQAHANAKAASLKLDADTLAELDAATEPVKAALGKNPDLWQSEPNGRFR